MHAGNGQKYRVLMSFGVNYQDYVFYDADLVITPGAIHLAVFLVPV